jgi:hypothetical protein
VARVGSSTVLAEARGSCRPSPRSTSPGLRTRWERSVKQSPKVASRDPEQVEDLHSGCGAAEYRSDAQKFQDDVLTPFAQRFSTNDPFGAVKIRGFYVDGDTVIVMCAGAGTTAVGSSYENTYAWIMTLNNGQVVDGTAFYDSISFNELWKIDPVSA